MRGLIESSLGVGLRRAAATVYCRTGADCRLAPASVVISHPKSGRTWLRIMLAEAGIHSVGFSHAGSGEQASLTIGTLKKLVPDWHSKRVLLLVRDPRDTVVSFYFQATRRSRIVSESFSDFLRDPRFGIERAMNFNLFWLEERQDFAAFHLISYEQLHDRTEAALREAARFLSGRELSEFELKRAVARCTFDELHKLELSGNGRKRWGFRLAPGDRSDPESFKTRRGVVGAWHKYFSREDCDYVDALLEKLNYFARFRRMEIELNTKTILAAAA